ncbi:hypothetical protein [Corynebacterium spheniscorum]|uniref:ABC-2 type transport system permease protein n=1 Tax=Corynebacterium spheniscorum TaxID=185761 RepID=A0A1I2TJF2_9CORY|nr:hypothetical protein [Corynebacterium spheniscorum]KAA8719881.1 hypothetical protein F4V56_08960 [Corynebacterium spheniscorum]SFG62626.1 ABC-2 type transport system permease protein [Corynebacterium spheniscorum]
MTLATQQRPTAGSHFQGFKLLLTHVLRFLPRFLSSWALVLIAIFLAVLSPLTAKYLPDLINTFADAATKDLVAATMPEPSWQEAYGQWFNNLTQLFSFTAIVIVANYLSSAYSLGGQAAFILSRNIGRSAYFLAHFLRITVLLVLATALGSRSTWAVTKLIFPDTPFNGQLAAGTALWCLSFLVILGFIALAAAIWKNMMASAGVGFLIYVLMALGGLWVSASHYLPTALATSGLSIAQGAAAEHILWPCVSATAITLCCAGAGLYIFGRNERI